MLSLSSSATFSSLSTIRLSASWEIPALRSVTFANSRCSAVRVETSGEIGIVAVQVLYRPDYRISIAWEEHLNCLNFTFFPPGHRQSHLQGSETRGIGADYLIDLFHGLDP